MKHVGIEIKFYNLDTFKKQIDVNFIDLDSELVDLNYKVASLIFCHLWRSIPHLYTICILHQNLLPWYSLSTTFKLYLRITRFLLNRVSISKIKGSLYE